MASRDVLSQSGYSLNAHHMHPIGSSNGGYQGGGGGGYQGGGGGGYGRGGY